MEKNRSKKNTQRSGAQKRKTKKKEKEEAIKEEAIIEEAVEELERLKLGPTALWTGLVVHHKDVFVSHVLSKLNGTDQSFFGLVNTQSWGVLKYSGVDVWKLRVNIFECSSISTLEWKWNHIAWGEEDNEGNVIDQAWFCAGVAGTNKLEFLKWAREVKHCEWDEETITVAALIGNLEMLKYCFSNECPYDEKEACGQATLGGHLDCLRFLFDKVKPSRNMEAKVAMQAACSGHVDILKYLVEEREILNDLALSHNLNLNYCVATAARNGRLDCLKYLVEEAKAPLNDWRYIAEARYFKHPECENYLLEKGCPEPTDEQYVQYVQYEQVKRQ